MTVANMLSKRGFVMYARREFLLKGAYPSDILKRVSIYFHIRICENIQGWSMLDRFEHDIPAMRKCEVGVA